MIEKEILKNIIFEQRKLVQREYILRDKFKDIEKKKKSDFVVIITGIRRCGKSYLLNMFKDNQKEKDYYINFDDERLNNFEAIDFEKLYQVFIELFDKQSTFYFDEIQNITGWEKFVRRLNDYSNKVYITGSNANLLSKELGTHLTGRYVSLELFPISFKEFMYFKEFNIKKNDFYDREKVILIKKYLEEYIRDGGFLKYLQTKDKDFFKTLYESIMYRDIITRYNLNSEKAIKEIFYYLISNVSKEYSYTNLKNMVGIANITSIKDYISYFENSYLLFSINLYDKSLKKQLVNPKKIYCIDSGLANTISFKFSEDRGRLLENLIFIELKRRGKEIYYHKQKKECDFVIKEGLEIIEAIQVTKSLEDIDTRNREILGLIEAMKIYNLKEGLILNEDEEAIEQHLDKKILIKPIWKWLLEN